MYMLLRNLTLSPSVFYFTTGLSKMPGIKVTVPLQQMYLINGQCQHLPPLWVYSK